MAAGIYSSAKPITPGTDAAPGNGVCIACSAAGTVRLVMADNTLLDIYATQGTAIIDNISVRGVVAASTTATCTVSVLRSF